MKNIHFINAGAGSGKTYKLTTLLSENILTKKCAADQVILTTFTEKAAAELKARAREELLKKGETHQANLLASAAIGTVHSVAFQLIKKFWYHLGESVDLKVMTEEDVTFYLNQALAEVPTAEELARLRKVAVTLSFKDEFQVTNYDLWKAHLNKIVGYVITYRIEDLEISESASLQEVSEIFPTTNVQINGQALRAVFVRLRRLLEDDNDSAVKIKRIKKADQLLSKKQWRFAEYIDAKKPLEDTTGAHRAAIPEINDQLEQLSRIYSSLEFVTAIEEYINLVFDLAKRSVEAFREYKKNNRLIDFNDMESMLLELLEHEEVRQEVQESFKQVYVDEFQDSSPIQFEIFNRLSELVKQSYWVGDPKQAIYGFRGTNPELIRAIVHSFPDETRGLSIENLEYSWRSRPGIVDICNRIFVPALKNQVNEKYISLKAVRSDTELPGDKHHPVRHWHATEDKKGAGNKDQKWHHLAESIQSFLQEGMKVTQEEKCKYHLPDDPERKSYHPALISLS